LTVPEVVEAAWTAVTDAERLPEDMQTVAFREVLRHMLLDTKHFAAEHAQRMDPSQSLMAQWAASPVEPSRRDTEGSDRGAARLEALATRLGVSASRLEDIMSITDDGVQLYAPSSRVSSMKSTAARELALAVVAARQGSGLDDGWTNISEVREVVKQFGRYDESNFSTSVRALGDVLSIKGRGVGAQLRLTQPGWEAAAKVFAQLLGETNV
jgi:hypothetical protein